MRNPPVDRLIIEAGVKSICWEPTVIWRKECPGSVKSQLDILSNDFLGQLVGTDCAIKPSDGGVKIPLDGKSSVTNGYPTPFPARNLNKKLPRQTYPPIE